MSVGGAAQPTLKAKSFSCCLIRLRSITCGGAPAW
jgi:hypothetical protein